MSDKKEKLLNDPMFSDMIAGSDLIFLNFENHISLEFFLDFFCPPFLDTTERVLPEALQHVREHMWARRRLFVQNRILRLRKKVLEEKIEKNRENK